MNLLEKLSILGESAKYDASCASSSSTRKRDRSGGIGTASASGICHSWSADGRCISLLKILMTNYCVYDCAYCVNRSSNDVPRTAFTPEEIASLTIEFYKRNYIEGLFLSSGVLNNPDHTMELMIKSMRLLRKEHGFGGYIHVKLIPGASPGLVEKAGLLADRVSVNIELPSEQSLCRLAPQKKRETIIGPMKHAGEAILASKEERRKSVRAPLYSPAGQSTQLIVGATSENDLQILRLSEWFYNKMRLKRVYYSAYVPVNSGPRLPSVIEPPLRREHRLYQADWLLRFYGFQTSEIVTADAGMLDEQLDPKTAWALAHPERFPVEIQTADYWELLRVPGIGVLSAKKIVRTRKSCRLEPEHLKPLRVVTARAKWFITVNGKTPGVSAACLRQDIRRLLAANSSRSGNSSQLLLFGS